MIATLTHIAAACAGGGAMLLCCRKSLSDLRRDLLKSDAKRAEAEKTRDAAAANASMYASSLRKYRDGPERVPKAKADSGERV